jgi:hypothetical protein
MQIIDSYITGWCDQCWEHFNRSIGQYKRYYKYAKIGITVDYRVRASQHERREKKYKWERMIVLYKTTSENNANYVEGYYQKRDDFVNKWYGWSRMSPTGEYYVYLLLGNHKYRRKR